MTTPSPALKLLSPSAPLPQRWLALRHSIPKFYLHQSRTSSNPSIFHAGDILCTTSNCTLPSEESLEDDQVLDSILDWYRERAEFKGAIIWYLNPAPPAKLDARLYARGVCPNWEPHWMWCELGKMTKLEMKASGEQKFTVRVKAEEGEVESGEGGCLAWEIHAMREEEWLGGCILFVATGEHGVAGLFDMFVHPKERRQGIGAALTVAACELARKVGCHHVLLNATDEGEPVYSRVGFESMGKGRTWFLNGDALARPRPSSRQVKFLEAVGMGDIDALNAMKDEIALEQMSEQTVNGETPLEIAVRCKQPFSAQWVIDRDVVPDIMSLWDLGWRDRIPALLLTHPDLVLRKSGRWSATPLHTAIERDDIQMVKLLLIGPVDLDIKDGVMQSTPMGWAKHLQRTEMIKLLGAKSSMT